MPRALRWSLGGGGLFLMSEVPLCVSLKSTGWELALTGWGANDVWRYRGYARVRTRTTLGAYSRSLPRSIGPSYGR